MKKALVTLLLSFTTLGHTVDCCSPFTGFYIGEAVGLAVNHADVRSQTAANFDIGNATYFDDQYQYEVDLCRNNAYGSFFAGYGVQLGCGPYTNPHK